MPSKLAELKTRIDKVDQKLVGRNRTPDERTPTPDQVFGAPTARKGESALTSRGFQFQRLIGLMGGVLEPEQCKVEAQVAEMMRKQYIACGAYNMTGGDRYVSQGAKSFLMPLAADMMIGQKGFEVSESFRHEIKSMVVAGVPNVDYDEIRSVVQRGINQGWKGYQGKTVQSWIDETLGGSLVAPAAFGELIQLLRNKDALINAGARVEALPPQGRLKLPRQTTPTLGYFVGENTGVTGSTFGTGFLELSARKCAALVVLPNELIRYASPASEAILRADMTKTLSLTADYQLLYGEGSDVFPLGLVNTPNISVITPTDTGSGDSANTELAPQDLFQFISAIEANNGEFQGWILRPELFYAFVQARAGVYNGSAVVQAGQFVYDQFRQLGQGFAKTLAGYPAVTTPQVSITRPIAGGTATGTTVFGGQWDDYIIAMFGSIEFAPANQYGGGQDLFTQDQSAVRAILSLDGAPRHPGVFCVADGVTLTVGA